MRKVFSRTYRASAERGGANFWASLVSNIGAIAAESNPADGATPVSSCEGKVRACGVCDEIEQHEPLHEGA